MGPGGKTTLTEHNKGMDGGSQPEEKTYSYDEYNSMGEAVHSKGTLDGDIWTWTSAQKMNGQTMQGRFTMKTLSATSYWLKYEISQDGTNGITAMAGKGTKVK
jgi:hypothetical protein